MYYNRYTPSYPLCDVVEYLWCMTDGPTHSAERILPGGTTELVFNLQDNGIQVCDPLGRNSDVRLVGPVVSGPYSRAFDIDASRHRAMLGVHFKPGGARALLGIPLRELVDTHVELAQLWTTGVDTLRARVCEARSDAERFRSVEAELTARLSPDRVPRAPLATAVAALATGMSQPPIGTLAERTGLSHRAFIRQFTTEVGMTPKSFARVRRFHVAVTRIKPDRTQTWSEFAADCGYADQAHMIREFRSFAGMTPAQYHLHASAATKDDHVALTA
jgi:AraC-like DNA-binding protein